MISLPRPLCERIARGFRSNTRSADERAFADAVLGPELVPDRPSRCRIVQALGHDTRNVWDTTALVSLGFTEETWRAMRSALGLPPLAMPSGLVFVSDVCDAIQREAPP